jgi:beta-lactamase superfamily II metal-dependent hydrolase
MPFELEFMPVGNGESSGDAIVLRYMHTPGNWRVGVIDGGYLENGEAICAHIEQYYGTRQINFVVSTHPDNDHMSGLRVVLESMRVDELWMHVPHAHAARIIHLFRSRRWQVANLETELRRSYNYVEELLDLATAQGTKVRFPFQGESIGPFTVLSPTLNAYEKLLPQFRDTPPPDLDVIRALGHLIEAVGRRVSRMIRKDVPENWLTETLREGGTTAPENESSVVLYGDLGSGGILLTADAGLVSLQAAIHHLGRIGIFLPTALYLFQVPHHGSRNNLSPSMLDQILGSRLLVEGTTRQIQAIVSAGKEDPDHPREVVVNALVRRGVRPIVTRGSIIRFAKDVQREGWAPAPTLGLSGMVEAYD